MTIFPLGNRPRKNSTSKHPYLSGNFAPVIGEYISHTCEIVQGRVPEELYGGQYVRNGGNPVNPPDEGRNYHWFDGDGMLHGVYFPKPASEGSDPDPPQYTNRHVSTPILSLSLMLLRAPLPSISLLISPLTSLHRILGAIITTFLMAFEAGVGTLSVVNTNVLWWGAGLGAEAAEEEEARVNDENKQAHGSNAQRGSGKTGRLLGLCESGPPMEVRVPELQTVGWDRLEDDRGENLSENYGKWDPRGWRLARIQEDWMTAHPRVDPINGDLVFYQCTMFEKPYLKYSVIDRHGKHQIWKYGVDIGKPKMMHDFACSRNYTVFLNLPLTLTPFNMLSIPPRPMIHFNRHLPSEFIVMPRRINSETKPIRFIDPEPSMIFHTANTWDDQDDKTGQPVIDMVACRFKSAKLVYAAGAIAIPAEEVRAGFDDVVRLHYYRFLFDHEQGNHRITHNFPLCEIPFEFPATHPDKAMSKARYVYGCSMREGGFDERLGGAAKVDVIVKIDVLSLSRKGRLRGEGKAEAVDRRTVLQIMEDHKRGRHDDIQVFVMPEGWYAQESRFVPRVEAGAAEDDGWLLAYVYDEQYINQMGEASIAAGTGSELWIIDAAKMWQGESCVVCRIKLPQRVPYGLHGTWVPAAYVDEQRDLDFALPPQPSLSEKITASRFRHFVDIFSTRPRFRTKSLPERLAFAVLFPLSWVVLGFAAWEILRNHEDQHGSVPWLKTARSLARHLPISSGGLKFIGSLLTITCILSLVVRS